MASTNKSDLNAVQKLREKVNREKQATSKLGIPLVTPTQKKTESRTTQSSAPQSSNKSDPEAVKKLREKVGKERANTYSLSKASTTMKPQTATTKKVGDYSSVVKNMQDKGVVGASGIMTESEWRRRKGGEGGTYQDYLASQEANPTSPRSANLMDVTLNSIQRGYLNSKYGQESFKSMHGMDNKKDEYQKVLEGDRFNYMPDNKIEEWVSGAMEIFGQQVKQWTDPNSIGLATAGASAAAIGGQLGPQVLVPEEAITVPGAFVAGIMAGSAKANLEVEAGHAYNEMVENGISPDVAKGVATIVGVGNASLEMFQLDDLIKSAKILQKTNADSTITKKLIEYLVDRGKHVATETAQEVAQEGVTLAGVDLARGIEGKDAIYSWGDVGQRLGDTAISSAMSFAMLGAGGDVVNYGVNKTNEVVHNYKNAKTVADINKTAEALNGFIKDDNAKIQPLPENATKEEFEKKKAEINTAINDIRQKQTPTETNPLEQAAREVVESRKKNNGKMTAEQLDNLTRDNQPIYVAEVKAVTGFGDKGSEVVTKLANQDGVTFTQATKMVESAYELGLTGVEKKLAQPKLITQAQNDAFDAGRLDQDVQALADKEIAKNMVVNKESGFNTANLPGDVTKKQTEIVDLMAKAVGVKAYMAKGLKGNAEINHKTGEVAIDYDFEREVVAANGKNHKASIVFHAAHEIALHAVVDRAPEEGRAFVYAMYNHLAGNNRAVSVSLADQKRNAYAEQGVELSLVEAMEEISANNILYLYGNDEGKFHKAIDSIVNGKDTKAKQGLQKYIDYLKNIIRKIREFLAGKTDQERAEIQAELDEITKLKDMFEAAFAKAVENTRTTERISEQKAATELSKSESENNLGNVADEKFATTTYVKAEETKVEAPATTKTEKVAPQPKKAQSFIEQFNEKLNAGEIDSLNLERVEFKDDGLLEVRVSNKGKFFIRDIGNNRYEVYPDQVISQRMWEPMFKPWFDIQRNGGSFVNVTEPAIIYDNKISGRYDVISKGAVTINNNAKSSESLENQVKLEYNGSTSYALKGDYWVTDLNKTEYNEVMQRLRQARAPESTKITDTANWYMGRLDGDDLFVIYSSVYLDDPTILYESRGKNARTEQKILMRALEVIESERSAVEKQRIIDELLVGDWVQEKYDMAHNNDRLGERGSNTGYASVLQGEPSELIGSTAFRNVIENLFGIQRAESESTDVRHSLKDSLGNTLTEAQQEYFKDSKVRDENGNLLVMYHGTSEDFTIFDKKKARASGTYGRGFYFTRESNHANHYGEAKAYYLKIDNPLSTNEKTITKAQLKKFLEVIAEDEDYGLDNYGYGSTVESIIDGIYDDSDASRPEYQKTDFSILWDVNLTAIGNMVEAVELFNKVNGTSFDGFILPTETVTFNSEQAKLTSNKNPTSNPDTRFSLKKTVEETKDLIAVHNVWEDKLRQALELGGLPSPSIAITKKDFSHDKFGDISLVFHKDTISPTDRRNKVYGGDAYTPTKTEVHYKISDKVLDKIEERVNKLVDKDIRREFRFFLDHDNVESDLTRNDGSFVEAYKRNDALKIAFLKDKEIPFKPAMKTKEISRYADNIVLRRVARALGDETLKNAQRDSKVRSEVEPMVRKLLNDRMEEQGAPRIYKEQIDLFELDNILMAASEYIREGERKTVDYYATRDKLEKKFTKKLTAEYENWLAELGEGIIEKKGIRNDRDLFTPSGYRRSFEALHWDYTLENIVKSMNEKQSKGSAFWGGNVFGASTKEYESIADIKADSSRLQELTDEEYEALKTEYKDRLDDIARAYSNGKSFYDAEDTLIEAVATKKTKQGIKSYLGQFDYVYRVTDDIVNGLWELRNDIAQMPVSYFEAKPRRAVGFNEVAAAIIPRTKDKSLKAELESKGVNVLEYDKSKEGDRLKKINSVPNASFSLKTTNLSNKDTKELLDIIEHLKNEFEVTKFAKADPKKLAKMTKDLLKEYSSQADLDKTTKAIDDLYQYLANGEDGHPAAWNEVYSKAYEIAENIINNALVVDDELYTTYKGLREYLRTTPMKFNSERDSVPSGYDNFKDFRRRNWGRLNFTKDGMGVDSIYQELSDLYPEFFNADEQLTIEDMLARIVDVLDEIQPTEVNPYSSDMQQMTSFVANDIIDRFFDVPQAKPTFADKAERRVVEARIAGGKKVEAVRQQKDEKIQKLLDKQRAKTKKLIEKAKTTKAEAVNKEKAKREKAISNMKESQKAKVLRAQIMRHANDLSQKLVRPSDNKHIPENLKGLVAKVLECINLESNYTYDPVTRSYKKSDDGLPARRTEAFKALRDVYTQMAETLTIDPDLMGDDGLISEITGLASKRIVDMNSAELQTVWQTLCAVEATISTANKMFSKGKYQTIFEYAEKLWNDNNGKKGKYYDGLNKGLKVDMLTPETFFHFLGDAGDSIFRMMRDAQDKHISIMKEVADFTHKALKDVNVNSLEKTIHTVTLGGEEVQLSTAQLMELYVLVKREQAIDHIFKGGILPDVIAKKKKLTRAEPIRNISMAEISGALANLTDDQKKVADKLQKYVSTVLSEYGNEASMQVYNYKKFNEQNYWTIRTNKQEIQSEIGKDTSVTSVANKGMTKSTKPHANTSVRIGSIFDTFASHSSDMATYAAWLGTSEDVNRIRNFVFWNDNARVGTVKGILDTVHGTQGSKYLEKLLTDIAIGVRGVDNMNPFDFMGAYKAASVAGNARVVIQQPTAILRAMDMIGAQHLTAGAYRPLKGWEKAKKYAPIAQWKDWGYFDINTGRQMKDVLFDNASVLEKTKQAGMWGASMADSLSWGQLWNAVESETKAKHKELDVGSDEYYEFVAKRFTEIVDHTQVVDGILQRSQFMRNADGLSKMATSFMGEPTKQYNMAASALYDAKNTKGEARKKAVAKLGRTAMSLAVAGIANACAQSIIDAMRDDDKEKKYWEKWLDAFIGDEDDAFFQKLGNVGDTINPLTYVPYIKDALSILQGYDVKRMDMEAISKAWDATENLYKAITKTGKYTLAEASASFFAEVSRLFGLPVANVKRDLKSAVTTFAIETDNYLMQYRIEKFMLDINYAYNKKNFMDILFNAYNNDSEAYEIIYKDLLKSGYSEKTIKNGMETRMMKAEGVEEVKELEKRFMTPETNKQYDNSLKRIQSSQTWKSASSTQRKDAEADLHSFLTSDSEDMEATRAEARALGIDETEYTLWQLAKEMANNDGKDGLSTKERAAAIQKLDLDSNTEWDLYLFKNETKGAMYARDNGVQADTYADFIEALYKVDKPTKNGNYGSFTQDEATEAIRNLDGLSRKEKAALWQSVNTKWKKNPF